MLRLLNEKGKPLSQKAQDKLCKEDKNQYVNPALPEVKKVPGRPKHPGLRPSGGNPKPEKEEKKIAKAS